MAPATPLWRERRGIKLAATAGMGGVGGEGFSDKSSCCSYFSVSQPRSAHRRASDVTNLMGSRASFFKRLCVLDVVVLLTSFFRVS